LLSPLGRGCWNKKFPPAGEEMIRTTLSLEEEKIIENPFSLEGEGNYQNLPLPSRVYGPESRVTNVPGR